jgi:hypothetical protein
MRDEITQSITEGAVMSSEKLQRLKEVENYQKKLLKSIEEKIEIIEVRVAEFEKIYVQL